MRISGIFKGIPTAIRRLSGTYPLSGELPLSEAEYRKSYDPVGVSFTDFLPWVVYDPEHQVFLLDDNISVGAVFELSPVDVDAMPADVVSTYEDHIVNALHTLPTEGDYPWIVQFYLQDEPLHGQDMAAWLTEYANDAAKGTKLTTAWINTLQEFYDRARQGLFSESGDTRPWRALARKVRICIYRNIQREHYYDHKGALRKAVVSPAAELEQACDGFLHTLKQAGFGVRRCDGNDFHRWMLPWLSPKPTGYDSAWDYLQDHPWAGEDEDRTFAYDIGKIVVTNPPSLLEADREDLNGIFEFCDQLQRFISLQGIEKTPKPGVLTADRVLGKRVAPALWEKLPTDSIFVSTIVIRSQDEIGEHVQDIVSNMGAATYEQDLTHQQADTALKNRVFDDRLFSIFSGVYIRADDVDDMYRKTRMALSALSHDFTPIAPKDDPISDTTFLHMLPMAYSFQFDSQKSVRSRLAYSRHIARVLPLYGRGRGTDHPGLLWFNRVGETFAVDPYSKKDRKKTAHGLLFGPTGSGKSASLVLNALHGMAMRHSRQFFIEKGKSFYLLALFYKSMGLSTNTMIFTPKANISLPPYAMAEEARAQIDDIRNLPEPEDLISMEDMGEDDDFDDSQRDYLGEMEMMTQIMITGANEKENEKMTRQDQFVIQQAIIEALEDNKSKEASHPIVEDVYQQLVRLANTEESAGRRDRVMEMAQSLKLWTQGLRGQYFNRLGESWPEVDATFIDMGILTQDQNKDMLAVALISLVNAITGIGEKYQYDPRETEVTGDEWHVIAKNPVLIKPFVFGVKTWRKLGVWLTQATQNLDDFPDQAEAMLNLAEWWYCMVMPKKEIDDISRFRDLTDEEKRLLGSARKEPGKYVEGVVMSDTVTSLFRIVMPGLALALAQTDNDEKVRRHELMKEHNINELQAALMIAKELDEARSQQR